MDKVFLDVALITAITEAIKRAIALDGRYVPLVSLGLGIVLSLVTNGLSLSSALLGLVLGLSASGLYSGGKSVIGK